jgi:sugar phosphate isomerase/epimerase
MTIGLSTYAFFWERSARVSHPIDLFGMIERTAGAGADVLQICDYQDLQTMSQDQMARVRSAAEKAGIALELGVRGIRARQLEHFLDLANALGAHLVRTMLTAGSDRPGVSEAVPELRRMVPRFAADGVTLALETYEQVPTNDLLAIVDQIGDPHVGICLDVANVVARLENPDEVIDRAADHVVNLHVKDFRFEREAGLVGFSLTGCLLGTGQLDLDHLYQRVRPGPRKISQIVEHWLPWQADEATTVQTEREWTAHALATIRAMPGRASGGGRSALTSSCGGP